MLRLTFLLCSGLFLVMLLGGRDFGQLRPGLVQADLDAQAAVLTAAVPAVETVTLMSEVAVEAPVVQEPVLVPRVVASVAPAPAAPMPIAPVAVSGAVTASAVVVPPANTVFTLATYADVPVDADLTVAAETPEATGDGEIWYVTGNSLNVRSGPSTDDAVVGRLTRGEATLVVWREGEDWARIRIEGDGIEGYVAMRFLTPTVPVNN